MGSIKLIGIIAGIVMLLMLWITNEKMRDRITSILNKKWCKKKIMIKNLVVIAIWIGCIVYSISLLKSTKKNLDFATTDMSKQTEALDKTLAIAEEQADLYRTLMKRKVDNNHCKNPYIPDGFQYIEGEWNTGFVIEDENHNQFVWVPCTNIDNEDKIPILKKDVFDENSVNYFSCYEQEDFKEFLMSCLENGGFYISRFEIGKENNIPVSKANVEAWTEIDWNEAKSISEKMYTNIHSKLINGYAMDTAIRFILDKVDRDNIEKTTGITGNQSYHNIYDLVDDMMEWTSEMKHGLNIMRGTVFGEEGDNEFLTYSYFVERFAMESSFQGDRLGFRTIIYK